jgi:hypothetical protein
MKSFELSMGVKLDVVIVLLDDDDEDSGELDVELEVCKGLKPIQLLLLL